MLSGRITLLSHAAQLFLEEIGIDANPFDEPKAFKEACSQANPRYKDKKDLVRFQLEEDASYWKPSQRRATMILARELGMFNEKKFEGAFDVGLALGGARRSPLHRACYIVEAIVQGKASVKVIVIAGSARPLNESEQAAVQDYAPRATTEFDLCQGAANYIYKRYPSIEIETVCNSNPRSGNLGVIASTMEHLVNNGVVVESLAGSTTGIYRTGLMLDLMLAKPEYGWTYFDAAGHPSDPEMVFNRTVATYCAENLTTLSKAADVAAIGL